MHPLATIQACRRKKKVTCIATINMFGTTGDLSFQKTIKLTHFKYAHMIIIQYFNRISNKRSLNLREFQFSRIRKFQTLQEESKP